MLHVLPAAQEVRAAAPSHGRGHGGSARRRHEIRLAYWLLAPAAVLVLGVLAYPLAWEIWTSLTDSFVGNSTTTFVGLANYAELLRDPAFWRGAANAIGYLLLSTALKLAVGIGVALVLARPSRLRPIAFIAAFLPWAYPSGLALVGWYWFMIPPLHTVYSAAMADARYWLDGMLGEGTWQFSTLVVFNAWRGGSFVGVFLLAALNGIPQDLFDYASLEVKSGWRRFWYVTVPILRPFLALAAFLAIVSAVTDLGNVYMLSGLRITYLITWTEAFHLAIIGGLWGKAAAEALILLPLLGAMLYVCYRVFEPLEDDLA